MAVEGKEGKIVPESASNNKILEVTKVIAIAILAIVAVGAITASFSASGVFIAKWLCVSILPSFGGKFSILPFVFIMKPNLIYGIGGGVGGFLGILVSTAIITIVVIILIEKFSSRLYKDFKKEIAHINKTVKEANIKDTDLDFQDISTLPDKQKIERERKRSLREVNRQFKKKLKLIATTCKRSLFKYPLDKIQDEDKLKEFKKREREYFDKMHISLKKETIEEMKIEKKIDDQKFIINKKKEIIDEKIDEYTKLHNEKTKKSNTGGNENEKESKLLLEHIRKLKDAQCKQLYFYKVGQKGNFEKLNKELDDLINKTKEYVLKDEQLEGIEMK